MTAPAFPTDPVTVAALRSACVADDETGRSHLTEFLDFGAEKLGNVDIGPGTSRAVHLPGYEPWSVNSVITALCDEIEQLRTEQPAAAGGRVFVFPGRPVPDRPVHLKRHDLGMVTLTLRRAGERLAHPCDCASKPHRWRDLPCTGGQIPLEDGSTAPCPLCKPHSLGEHLWDSTADMTPGPKAANTDPRRRGWAPDTGDDDDREPPPDPTVGAHLEYRRLLRAADDAAMDLSRFIDRHRPDRLAPVDDPATDEQWCAHHLALLGLCEPRWRGSADKALCKVCYEFSLQHRVKPTRMLLEMRREGRRWTEPVVREEVRQARAEAKRQAKGKRRKGKAS